MRTLILCAALAGCGPVTMSATDCGTDAPDGAVACECRGDYYAPEDAAGCRLMGGLPQTLRAIQICDDRGCRSNLVATEPVLVTADGPPPAAFVLGDLTCAPTVAMLESWATSCRSIGSIPCVDRLGLIRNARLEVSYLSR